MIGNPDSVDSASRSVRSPRPVNWKDYPYPFVVGQPSSDSFPIRSWNRAMRNALVDEHRGPSLHDLVDRDDPLLVEQIRRTILPSRGINAEPSQILITMGSQHGIHLVSQAILGPGSRVGVEEPGYPDARHIFRRQGADLIPLAGRRPGPDSSRFSRTPRPRVRHTQPPVPDQCHDGRRSETAAPGACRGTGLLAHGGRLRLRVPLPGSANPGSQSLRRLRADHLRRKLLQVPGAWPTTRIHRRRSAT